MSDSKIAVITGASKGIGKATAACLLELGWQVFNVSRTVSDLAGIENLLTDLAALDAAERVAEAVAQIPDGEIHLIHNASRLTSDSVQSTTGEDLAAIVNVNLVGPQHLNHALIPKMQPGSSIIYVGSTLSEKAVPNSFTYVTTKHAMVGMMRATCQDLAGSGIHTACICPGFTNTEMLRAHVGDSDEILASIASSCTFGRLIEPSEIADTIVFAAQHPILNGAVVHANLGQIES